MLCAAHVAIRFLPFGRTLKVLLPEPLEPHVIFVKNFPLETVSSEESGAWHGTSWIPRCCWLTPLPRLMLTTSHSAQPHLFTWGLQHLPEGSGVHRAGLLKQKPSWEGSSGTETWFSSSNLKSGCLGWILVPTAARFIKLVKLLNFIEFSHLHSLKRNSILTEHSKQPVNVSC